MLETALAQAEHEEDASEDTAQGRRAFRACWAKVGSAVKAGRLDVTQKDITNKPTLRLLEIIDMFEREKEKEEHAGAAERPDREGVARERDSAEEVAAPHKQAEKAEELQALIVAAYKTAPNVKATQNWLFVLERLLSLEPFTLQIQFPSIPGPVWERTGDFKESLLIPVAMRATPEKCPSDVSPAPPEAA